MLLFLGQVASDDEEINRGYALKLRFETRVRISNSTFEPGLRFQNWGSKARLGFEKLKVDPLRWFHVCLPSGEAPSAEPIGFRFMSSSSHLREARLALSSSVTLTCAPISFSALSADIQQAREARQLFWEIQVEYLQDTLTSRHHVGPHYHAIMMPFLSTLCSIVIIFAPASLLLQRPRKTFFRPPFRSLCPNVGAKAANR